MVVNILKTLIINGSPRENGNCATLTKEMIKYLKGEVKIINTYYDDISPCTDCRYCWENNGCSINDEMQEVYKLFDEVDNVIIASPIYFSELTGKLLSFASRLQYFYSSRYIRKDSNFRLKRKNSILILTGGGDGSIKPAIERANIIFRHINAQQIGIVLSLKTNEVQANKDDDALNNAKELALKLNKLSS